MKKLAITILMSAALFSFPCLSSERADHFQATSSPTLAAEHLEAVHLASERGDVATIKRSGEAYVKATTPLIR